MNIETEQEDGIWEKTLGFIQGRMGEDVVKTWFQSTSLKSINGKKATIVVPNKFFGMWLGQKYHQIIGEALQESRPAGAGMVELEFVVGDHPAAPILPVGKPEHQGANNHRSHRRSSLNPLYTFENFVVGSSNKFVHAASMAVAEGPGNKYNPLFIYGEVGLGKTHLLHSIGNFVNRKREFRTVYVTAVQFTNEVINSIRYDKMDDFRRRYRNIDILLIDDIQFLQGKERTQEEFFHTFNVLHDEKKQIVVSSDLFPKDMSSITERLRSRFEMGLIADIQHPDLETRIAILRKKSEKEGLTIGDDVVQLLAERLTKNIRELEGALTRLEAYSTLTDQTVTTDMAKNILRDLLLTEKKVITLAGIQEVVARRFQVKISDLKSKRRIRTLVHPRQIAMHLSRVLTNSSFPEIGREFGGKDHTTIMHACRQIEKAVEHDRGLQKTLDSLKDEIGKA